MHRLASVDPGVRATGIAVFDDGVLTYAWLCRAKGRFEHLDEAVRWGQLQAFDEVVVELPQVYRNSPGPAALIDLAFVDGYVCGAWGCPWTTYLPKAWKGNQPKEATQRRIKEALTPKELECINMPCASLQHNVWDAIGIGMKHLGRIR